MKYTHGSACLAIGVALIMALAPVETVGIKSDGSMSTLSSFDLSVAVVGPGHLYLPDGRRMISCIIDGEEHSFLFHKFSSTPMGIPGFMLKAGISLIICSGKGTYRSGSHGCECVS